MIKITDPKLINYSKKYMIISLEHAYPFKFNIVARPIKINIPVRIRTNTANSDHEDEYETENEIIMKSEDSIIILQYNIQSDFTNIEIPTLHTKHQSKKGFLRWFSHEKYYTYTEKRWEIYELPNGEYEEKFDVESVPLI